MKRHSLIPDSREECCSNIRNSYKQLPKLCGRVACVAVGRSYVIVWLIMRPYDWYCNRTDVDRVNTIKWLLKQTLH